MTPTGRRAWRKWLKSQRKHDKDSWAANIGACLGRAAYARRHRGTDAGQGLPDVVPTVSATPFTARSLVGMTMGARKRRWAKDYDALPQFGRFSKTMSMLRAYGVYPKEGNPLAQRLRPCPGCWNCQTTWQQSSIYSQTAVMHRHGCSHDDPSGLCCFGETVPVKMECDGSGVLPSRFSKRVRAKRLQTASLTTERTKHDDRVFRHRHE